jgi:DNA-binding CsgD family transcriptional regulator/tetratricopeptide (TPR) repeat protein
VPSFEASPVFIGRTRELGRLQAALRGAAAGEASVVLVGGEAGVGKTRLVEELAARAGDAAVLVGGCVEMGGDGLPLAPVAEALRRLVRRVGPDELNRLISGRRADLARVLPELIPPGLGAEAGALRADGSSGGHRPDIGRLSDLVLAILEGLAAAGPVLFVVEDLHWADSSTRALLSFLIRNVRGSRVLLVITFRSDELHRGHPMRPFLAESERLAGVERVELPRFGRAEVAEQIGAILAQEPPEELVDNIHRRSEGNAFFVEELVCAARAGMLETLPALSPTLRDVLLERFERLSERTQRLVRIAAVGGRRVGHGLLAAVAEMADGEVWESVREAVLAGVLRVDAEQASYVFRHALVQEAVRDEALPGELAYLHGRYAEAVEAEPALAGGGANAAAAAAHHWYSAHVLPRALPALLTAARAAAGGYAYAEAHHQLERALEIWAEVTDAEERTGVDHLRVVEMAVDAARAAGEWHRARALVNLARAEAERAGDPVRLAMALTERARLDRVLAIGDGIGDLQDALRLVPAEPPSRARARVLVELGKALNHASLGREQEARAAAEEGLAVARLVGSRTDEAKALIILGSGCVGAPWPGPEPTLEARRIARELGDDRMVLETYLYESDGWLAGCQFDAAVAAGREGLRLARRLGRGRSGGVVPAGNAIDALFRAGRWEQADQLLAEVIELAPVGVEAMFLKLLGADLAMARGRIDDAAEALTAARGLLTNRLVSDQWTLPLEHSCAELALWRGEPESVPARIVAELERFHVADATRYAAPLLAIGMRAAADMAERARARRSPSGLDDARAAAKRLDELAGQLVASRMASGPACLATIAAEQTRVDGPSDPLAWSASAQAWEAVGQPYPRAYALLRAAEASLSAGDRDRAAWAAGEASLIVSQLGAVRLQREIDALVRRGRLGAATLPGQAAGRENGAGDGEPGDDGAGTAAGDVSRLRLTLRELDVLRLVAVGRTNPQIAAELFISAKTASTHVSNILGKLEVGTRGEAAAVAHRLRLFEEARPS